MMQFKKREIERFKQQSISINQQEKLMVKAKKHQNRREGGRSLGGGFSQKRT